MDKHELDALPVGAEVETAGGLRYTRTKDGRWRFANWVPVPTDHLLDPEHSRQPIRRVS